MKKSKVVKLFRIFAYIKPFIILKQINQYKSVAATCPGEVDSQLAGAAPEPGDQPLPAEGASEATDDECAAAGSRRWR